MAGGEGTRLRPLTCSIPKPMVPVGNRPIIDYVLGHLGRHGFEEALVTLHHLPHIVMDHLRDRAGDGDGAPRPRVRCYVEEVPLGTAGSVKNLEPELKDTFLVMSGDVLTDIDLGALVDFHRKKGAAVTIALTTVETPLEYGVVACDEDGRVTRFWEKPSWGEVFSDKVNTGIYVIEPEVLGVIEPGRVFDFSQNLFPLLLEAGRPLFGFAAEGYWCDIGNLAQYLQAHVDILEGRTGFTVEGSELGERIWVGPEVDIAPAVELRGPLLIGAGCCLGTGARVEGPVVLGREVIVGGQASIKRSVVGDHSRVGRLAEVRGAVLGRGVRLSNRVAVFDGAVLADEVRVGEGTTVKPNVKVWPARSVAPETVLGSSLVWGRAWGYGTFGDGGVKGAVNVDLVPETAARLGAVFGAARKMGEAVAVACDPAVPARLFREALVAGLGSAGVEVLDCGELPAAVLSYAVRALGVSGGVHAGARPGEDAGGPGSTGRARSGGAPPECCELRFLDENGLDIPRRLTRRLERALAVEDFRRAPPERLGGRRYVPGLGEAYLTWLRERGHSLRRKGLVVVGAYGHPWLEDSARELWDSLDVGHVPLGPSLDAEAAAEAVRREGAALAFFVDRAGEGLTLLDDRGRLLSRAQTWLVLSSVCIVRDGVPLAVPSDLPRAVSERLAALGARPVPTRAARSEVMARMRELEREAGPHLFRQSEMVFGGLLGVIGLLDHLVETETTLAEMVEESPLGEWVHLRIPCPWELKGRVMRLLLEEEEKAGAGPGAGPDGAPGPGVAEGLQAETDRGRILVIPDGERPAFHVYSEAADMEAAEELAALYAAKVRELAREGGDGAERED